MKVCLFGNKGNMGKRYQLILEQFCKCEVIGIDVNQPITEDADVSHIIIATPTLTHMSLLKNILSNFNNVKYILCEKPITKELTHFAYLSKMCHLKKVNLYMVNNYYFIWLSRTKNGFPNVEYRTNYNFYKHGQDGLAWDAIQLIKLSLGPVTLHNCSPVWTCMINGLHIGIEEIDLSYVRMLEDFVGHKRHMWGMDAIISAHQKVIEYEESQKNTSRNTSQEQLNKTSKQSPFKDW